MTWLTLMALAAGLCASLACWLALGWWQRLPARRDVLPAGVPLPLWWRLLAPLGAAFARRQRANPGSRPRQRALTWLRQAGWEHRITPDDVLGMQGAVGCAAGIWAALAAWALGLPPAVLAAVGGVALLGGRTLPRIWLGDQARARRRAIGRALPFVLDMVTLCVEGGLNLQGALQQAADKGADRVMREALQHTLSDIRTGMPRAEALRQLAQRTGVPAVGVWVTALIQAESLGMSLGPILRTQAEQRRAERFLHAEKLAMQAPVKMLLPLVTCIFPCTFIVLGFPIVIKLMAVFG